MKKLAPPIDSNRDRKLNPGAMGAEVDGLIGPVDES
jgi:hypothetical protein